MLITNGDSMMGTVYDDIHKSAMKLQIGDCLSFGAFVPNVDSLDIEIRLPMLWHVIDRDENRLKLLSYFFFEHTGYWSVDGDTQSVTWENSQIRSDLNNKYFYECFTESERSAICTTEVRTKTNDTGCIITKDKLYVPALEDIEAIPEHLKIGRGFVTGQGRDGFAFVHLMYCFYWLRDPGESEKTNLVVRGCADSELILDSFDYDADETAVRAIMWVDAEKIKELY